MAKTWSPQGCTPIHYHRQRRRDKVSVISGISVSPRRQRLGLYYQLYFDNIGQEEVCLFLRELLRHLRGQVIVVLQFAAMLAPEFPLDRLLAASPRTPAMQDDRPVNEYFLLRLLRKGLRTTASSPSSQGG